MYRERNITAQDIKRLLLRVYKQYRTGEITEQKAYKEAYILNGIIKAIEVTDLENRLRKIEGVLNNED